MIFFLVTILSSWGLCAGFVLPGHPSNGHALNHHISEANKLTESIANQSARELLIPYLVLCPGQDMCHGENFKMNYAFTMVPSCSTCDCDDACVRKSTCCPSKFLRIDNITDTSDTIPINDISSQPALSCVQPFWNMRHRFGREGYWLIDSCPNGYKCVTPTAHIWNITLSTPVTSLLTNETYLNIQCALCNNESSINLIDWKRDQILCTERATLLLKETHKNPSRFIFTPDPMCNILFYPPSTIKNLVTPCIFIKDSPCNASGLLSREKAYLSRACEEYYLPFSTCYHIYKNVYCAFCHFHSLTDIPIECDGQQVIDIDNFPTFTALMDFNDHQEIVETRDESCAFGHVYDKYMDKYLNVTCEGEYVLEQNLDCRPVYLKWGENSYEINMIFRPTYEIDKNVLNAMSIPLKIFLETRMREYDIMKYLCTIQILEIDVLYFGVIIEFTVKHPHEVDKMIEQLLHIFTIDHIVSLRDEYFGYKINVSSSIIGQRFHMYEDRLVFFSIHYTRHFVHPMTLKQILLLTHFEMLENLETCSESPTTIVVADWYRCPKVRMTTEDTRVGLTNYSLCLLDHDQCIPSRYFKKSLSNLQFDVCLDWYLSTSTTHSSSHDASSDDVAYKYLSLICLSLSSAGSILTIISYFIAEDRITSPGINIIILSLFLILANTIYTFSKLFAMSETLCVTVGMFVHFFWLAVVFWMSLSCFKFFQTFTNFVGAISRQKSNTFCLLLINSLTCLIFVGVNVIVSHVVSDGQSFGYSPRTCYIEDSNMILYTFALPVGVTVCINTFMFVVTASKISEKLDIRKSRDHQKVAAYFRLSTVTGMSWLFGFLGQFINFQVFSILHTVFSAGQGIFLYLAFGMPLCGTCSRKSIKK